MRPLSKLIIIVIMLVFLESLLSTTASDFMWRNVSRVRGRHRGLPLAVDRAVLLPSELVLQKQKAALAGIKPRDPQISTAP